MRGRNAQSYRSCEQPQLETAGDREHIGDHDVLQPQRVGNVEAQVGRYQEDHRRPQLRGQQISAGGREQTQEGHLHAIDAAGCDRTIALRWMPAVGIAIDPVVVKIDRARGQAERDECNPRMLDVDRRPAMSEQRADEDKCILHPLRGAQRNQRIA